MTVVVHTTPPLDGLPASDGESLRLLGTLKLGGVQADTRTAGWGANGKPFVTVDKKPVRSSQFSTIPGYDDPDSGLDASQRADAGVWDAYVEETVVDLVNHTLYSLPPNWPHLATAQLATLSFPMTQYVPDRLRSIHAARLKHVGLWGLGGVHDGDLKEEDQKRLDESFVVGPGGTKVPRKWSGWHAGKEIAERRRKFGEQELAKRYDAVFAPLVRKLGKGKFFYGSKPCSLDVALWAQLTLALDSKLPNQLLGAYLRDNCQELVKHQHRVQKALFPSGWPTRLPPPTPPTLIETVRTTVEGWWPFASKTTVTETAESSTPEDERKKAEEQKFKYARWAWFAGASVAVIGYVLLSGIVTFDFGDEEEWDEELWQELEEAMAEEEGEEVAEALEERRPTSRLPVWDDDEEEGKGEGGESESNSGSGSGSNSGSGGQGEGEKEVKEEVKEVKVEKPTGRSSGGLPVWEDGEDEREQEQEQEQQKPQEEQEKKKTIESEVLNGEPSIDEEIIDDFDPATLNG